MDNNKKNIAIAILIIIGLILCYLLSPYLNAIFYGLVFFVLSEPIYKILRKKKINHTFSFFIIVLLIFFIILIPLYLISASAIIQVDSAITGMNINVEDFIFLDNMIEKINSYFVAPNFSNNLEFLGGIVNSGINFIKNSAIKTFSNVFNTLFQLILSLFLLYYVLKPENSFYNLLLKHSPFSKENTEKLVQNFINVSNAGIIVSGISALIQGGLMTLVLFVFRVPGSLLLGLISFVLAFIPVVGVYFVWIPIAIINFIGGNVAIGVWMVILGLLISNTDMIYRPLLQKKFGKIHPLIGLFGTFMGLKFFGFIGVVIGPLILSYFFLIAKIIDEEFFSK